MENTVTGKKVEVVYQICGDYVAFHEMGMYVEYELGTYSEYPPEQMGTGYTNEILTKEQYDNWKSLTIEEQDKQVRAWIAGFSYSGDYSDMAIVPAIKIGKDYYVKA